MICEFSGVGSELDQPLHLCGVSMIGTATVIVFMSLDSGAAVGVFQSDPGGFEDNGRFWAYCPRRRSSTAEVSRWD